MSAAFEVLEGGLQTLVQDEGRTGLLAVGVPRGGALDTLSFRLANRLVGNADNVAALEIRSPGPMLRIGGGDARIALTGTSCGFVLTRGGVSEEWPSWRAVDLQDGDIVHIPAFNDTAVGYLAFSGGMALEPRFGSCSTFLRGGFGGLNGRALAKHDRLPLNNSACPQTPCLSLLTPPVFVPSPVLRVLPGPQWDHFTPKAQHALTSQAFTVSRDMDRMGMRLEGPQLTHETSADIPSDATTAGAIQVPGSRRPIILMKDCQTTGGYPKIATIISADLDLAGRLLPGAQLRFRKVSMVDAEEAREDAAHFLHLLSRWIVPVRAPAII